MAWVCDDCESFSDIYLPDGVMVALFTITIAMISASILGSTRIGRLVVPELEGRDRLTFGGGAALFLILLFALSWKGMFREGEFFWEFEKIQKEASEALRKADLEALNLICSAGSVPLTSENVVLKKGRPDVPSNSYTRYRLVESHGNCREEFSVEWTAREGHYFFVPNGREIVDVQFVSRDKKHGFHQRPTGIPLVHKTQPTEGNAYTSISTSGWAQAKQRFKRRECGATLQLNAVQLPIACLDERD